MHPLFEIALSFLAISASGALAKSTEALEPFVDVPDVLAGGEEISRRDCTKVSETRFDT